MWVENWVGRRYYLNWLGGLWIPYASHNPVDTWKMEPLAAKHPVLQGIKPWSFRDEVFSRYFLFDNPKRTELLQGTPSNTNNGAPRPVSWVYNVRMAAGPLCGAAGFPRQHAQRGRLPALPAERDYLDRKD